MACEAQDSACARSCARRGSLASSSASASDTAAANASSSSGTTKAPQPGVRIERVPSSAVDTTGVPCAMASSNTRPWVSVRDANTNASPAA